MHLESNRPILCAFGCLLSPRKGLSLPETFFFKSQICLRHDGLNLSQTRKFSGTSERNDSFLYLNWMTFYASSHECLFWVFRCLYASQIMEPHCPVKVVKAFY